MKVTQKTENELALNLANKILTKAVLDEIKVNITCNFSYQEPESETLKKGELPNIEAKALQEEHKENNRLIFKLTGNYEKTLVDFANSAEYKKYGDKTQQGMIDNFLKKRCKNQNYRRILKEIINEYYKIKTARKENLMLTIC